VARLEAVRLRRALQPGLPLPARQDLVREVLRLRPRLRAALPGLQLQGPPALLHQDLPLRRSMCAFYLPCLCSGSAPWLMTDGKGNRRLPFQVPT